MATNALRIAWPKRANFDFPTWHQRHSRRRYVGVEEVCTKGLSGIQRESISNGPKVKGNDFPRLKIRVRDELVAFGNPSELIVDEKRCGRWWSSSKTWNKWTNLWQERGEEVVFFDGRNAFETKIGKFQNAIVPDVSTTRDFVGEIESGKYDHLKEKPIITYCTGGIHVAKCSHP